MPNNRFNPPPKIEPFLVEHANLIWLKFNIMIVGNRVILFFATEPDFKVDVETLTESIRIVESNEEVLFGERLNAIMAGMISLFPLLLEELADECSDFSRSDQATRVNRHLVSLQKALYKSRANKNKNKNKNKKDVDFNHPKFQAGLDHVVDAFVETMESVGIKEKDRDSVMHELSQKMRGFEVKMNKLLKGVPFSELDSVKTPF